MTLTLPFPNPLLDPFLLGRVSIRSPLASPFLSLGTFLGNLCVHSFHDITMVTTKPLSPGLSSLSWDTEYAQGHLVNLLSGGEKAYCEAFADSCEVNIPIANFKLLVV